MEPLLDRLLDASLNRAAEALRVVEDLSRFAWELPGFARELKELRHDLLAALAPDATSRARLTAGRDIEEDVGRSSAVPRGGALGLGDLAARNLERAKEALRSLEEAAALRDPEMAARAGALRYRLYSVEKGILALALRPERSPMAGARLYLLAGEGIARLPLAEAAGAAIAGGVEAVQLRAKGVSDRLALEQGRALREITARAGIPLIVNDRPDLAVLLGADGVHLGQEDLPVAHARRILGAGKVVGVSTHSPDQARRAAREGADYIGAGPVFETATKDAGPAIGPDGLRAILEATDLPAFAIGGIGRETLARAAAAGARRAAVSSAILTAGGAAEIEATARALAAALARSP